MGMYNTYLNNEKVHVFLAVGVYLKNFVYVQCQ